MGQEWSWLPLAFVQPPPLSQLLIDQWEPFRTENQSLISDNALEGEAYLQTFCSLARDRGVDIGIEVKNL